MSLQLFVKMQKLKSNQRMMTSASWSIIPMAAMPSKSSLTISTKEFKVVYRKTPRFFPDDPKGNAELLKAVGDYISGKIIYLDITSSSNQDYPRDRLVNIDELPAEPDFEQLARLCIDKNLLSESELRFELQAGSTIGVHFWDTSKNFSYKMQGSKIVKF